MDYDDISYPSEAPRTRGPGRPETTPRELARVALCHERVQANAEGEHGPLGRRRADALKLAEGHANKLTTRARNLGLLDGDTVTERTRWLLAVDEMGLPAHAAEQIVVSIEDDEALAARHNLSLEQVDRARSGAILVHDAPESETDEHIAEALEWRLDTVCRIRAGEAGVRLAKDPFAERVRDPFPERVRTRLMPDGWEEPADRSDGPVRRRQILPDAEGRRFAKPRNAPDRD
jgi:hypothetical protein